MTSEPKLQSVDELGRALLRYTEYIAGSFPFGVPKVESAPALRLLAVAANVEDGDLTLFSSIVTQGLKWQPKEATLQSCAFSVDAIKSLTLQRPAKTLLVFGGNAELGAALTGIVPCFIAPTLTAIRSEPAVKKIFWSELKVFLDKKA